MANETNMAPIEKTVILNVDKDTVWEAISTSQGLKSWWMPNNFKAQLGQTFTLFAGDYGDSPCEVTALQPKDTLSFNWGKDWNITFKLERIEENITKFTLIHDGWDEEKETEFGQPHSLVRSFMSRGWDNIVNNRLPKYLTSNN